MRFCAWHVVCSDATVMREDLSAIVFSVAMIGFLVTVAIFGLYEDPWEIAIQTA